MEPVGTLSFTLYNNVPWLRAYQLLSGDTNAPISLVGASLHMQFRAAPGSDEVIADLSTTNGKLTIQDAANGVWAFSVAEDDAAQIPAGNYVHDMLVIPASGPTFMAFTGPVVVNQGVTRQAQAWQAS